MRVLIWHGYLLRGTGSNEYTRALGRTLSNQGHDVIVVSQEPHPADHDLGRARAVRSPLPGRLPVFVLDEYAEATPALLSTMSRAELDEFVAAQAATLRDLAPADLVIANHVLLGGPVGAASGMPYLVKAHGSELEYAMRGNSDLCMWAHDCLQGARDVVVGSEHVAGVLAELVGPVATRVVPPGVDVSHMAPQGTDAAWRALVEQAADDPANPGDERLPDAGNAERITEFLATTQGPTVVYVGKLSEQKGVHLLLEAVAGLDARVFIVGFGPARAALQHQAAELGISALFTGPLQHRHLAHLWAAADVSVVPSVFPEAFGMVAAEAAATGCPPVVAGHSGLMQVADAIAGYLPRELRPLLTFTSGDAGDLRATLQALLALAASDRDRLAAGCRRAVEELWSWDSVATQLVDPSTAGRPRNPDLPGLVRHGTMRNMTDSLEVRDNTERRRFQLVVDDTVVGHVTYRRDDVLVLTHTEIGEGYAGQGMGSTLARGVFDTLAQRGELVRLECPFLVRWVAKHPEYSGLVDAGSPNKPD